MADGGKNIGPVTLGLASLARMPSEVSVPTYERANLSAGMVHIGLGNFHRAHQAWYLHRLMQQGKAHDWAIIGAGVREADALQRERLLAQDCLTTLIELDPIGKSAEITGAMIDFLPVEPANGALIAQMSDPSIRIVSLTVTEGGYFIDPATGGFDSSHEDIQHDANNPGAPSTAFGAIIAALKARRDAGVGPFTVLSCDNLQGNGAIVRQAVTSLAKMSDPALAAWIEENCSFPNSMVDCIVPATGPSELSLIHGFGIDDAAPVTHENFRQWVIEDDFCAGRPPWEDAGATISNNVHAYEAMKLRVLNGGHQIIADPAEIIGIETIAGAMAHDGIRAFLRKVATDEITPHVAPVKDMDPASYFDLVERRFSNPEIKDTTRRVAFDGSSRHPGFLIPTIRDALAKGAPVSGLALASAFWARYCAGTREDGSIVAPNDPNWDVLHVAAKAAQSDPLAWLELRQFYGDLADDKAFAEPFAHWLRVLYENGVEQAIASYLDA